MNLMCKMTKTVLCICKICRYLKACQTKQGKILYQDMHAQLQAEAMLLTSEARIHTVNVLAVGAEDCPALVQLEGLDSPGSTL